MSSNSGADCCICNNQITCQAGSHWNNYTCQCDEDPLATPTPNNGGGGTYYYSDCTQYFWVLYECYPVGEHSWDCHEVARWEAGCWV